MTEENKPMLLASDDALRIVAKLVSEDKEIHGKFLRISSVFKVDDDGVGMNLIDQSIEVVERVEEEDEQPE